MATFTDEIFNDVKYKRDEFVADAFEKARMTFAANGVPNCSFRDIRWDESILKFVVIETGIEDTSFTLEQKLKYYPQLIPLLVIGSEKKLYS